MDNHNPLYVVHVVNWDQWPCYICLSEEDARTYIRLWDNWHTYQWAITEWAWDGHVYKETAQQTKLGDWGDED